MAIPTPPDAGPRPRFYPPGAARPCDYCKSAPALLFCRSDSAFSCISCDSKVHHNLSNNNKHERVWMCEVCEHAPAAVTCKADAAALCIICDRDIHSANPLASRHDRVPVIPFYDTAESVLMKSAAAALVDDVFVVAPDRKLDGYVSSSDWMDVQSKVMNNNPPVVDSSELKAMELLLGDSDQFLDFENYQIGSTQGYGDSVVPVQIKPAGHRFNRDNKSMENQNRFEIDFARSTINSYNNGYTPSSLSHSVSSSSMEVGVVPDGGSLSSEISYGNGNPGTGGSIVTMDREARVLRYREKRKNRKFEKTIRYASRKAYAETRPRIKGRFAKRNDAGAGAGESEMEGIFAANFMADARYGVVPSF